MGADRSVASLLCQYGVYILPKWQGRHTPLALAVFAKAKAISYERSRVASRHARFGSRGASLGIQSAGTLELIEQLEAGFPFDALRRFETNSGVASVELISIRGIPGRTLARRRTAGRLAPEESERLLRISSVFERAAVRGRCSLCYAMAHDAEEGAGRRDTSQVCKNRTRRSRD